MKLKILNTLSEIEEIAEDWNLLLSNSASHVPFLRHEYIDTWWKTMGGGEWDQGDLYVVTARTEQGELCGIAPLFFTQNLDGEDAVMLIGSIEISDYLDLIARPEDMPAFIDALMQHLAGPESPAWKVLDWYNFLEDSITIPILESAAAKQGWRFSQEITNPAPSIDLPEDWDTYLAGINKKQRHEIRRKLRRADNHFIPVSWYIVEDESTLDAEIDDFLALMAYDAEKESFLTDVMRSQMRASVHAAFRAGWLQLAFLVVGDEKAAAYLNFDFEDRIWIYNSGINFDYGSLSPGWILLAHLIQWAIENKRQAIDFMRGDEAYKYRFGGIDRHVIRAKIQR